MTRTKNIITTFTPGTLLPIKAVIFLLLAIAVTVVSNASYGNPAFNKSARNKPGLNTHTYDRQWYLGGGTGISDPLFNGIDNGLRLDLYTGIEVSDQVAVEAGVIRLGEFDTSANNSIDINGATIALRGLNRINKLTSLYMKLGILAWQAEPTLFLNGTQIDAGKESGQSFWIGFGFALNFGRNITLWSGADHFSKVDDVDVNSYSGGVQFNF